MATTRQYPEWREVNAGVKYPFADHATLQNNGQFLPENLFLDASLYPIGADGPVHLSDVIITNDSCTLCINVNTKSPLASTTFDQHAPPAELYLTDAYGRPAGLLVSTEAALSAFSAWPPGHYTFTAEQTEFAASVCIPMPEVGFRGFVLEDGSLFSGDVWLVGEDGVVLTPLTVNGRFTIRVDIVGDPLYRRKLCEDVFEPIIPLRKITVRNRGNQFVCEPDLAGNFQLTTSHLDTAKPVLRIHNTEEGLIFEAAGKKISEP